MSSQSSSKDRLASITAHISAPSQAPMASSFDAVPLAPTDPLFGLMAAYKADTFDRKVDLGVGAYRDDNAKPWILPVVKKAETILSNDPDLNHEYLPIAGLPTFTSAAARLILGPDSPAIKEQRVTSVQTISGTGAVHIGALFLAKFYPRPQDQKVYLSNPTWANHPQIFSNVGLASTAYPYFHPPTKGLDFDGFYSGLESAPEGSIILLHACAHNPTGVDPTKEQWIKIAEVIRQKRHFPFFDCAYQGFASGNLDNDAWAIRYFVQEGFELCVAQSFAKNLGLYGERAGCFHFVSPPSPGSQEGSKRIASQLAILQRSEISNPPAYGARIANLVLNDERLFSEWCENLSEMSGRIKSMRTALHDKLVDLGTPGDWSHILKQIGMFSFTGLTEKQVLKLREESHIYLTKNGRISMTTAQHPHRRGTANNFTFNRIAISMSLVNYASSDDEGADSSTSTGIPKFASAAGVVAAPDVSLEDPMQLRQSLIKQTDKRITTNMTYEQLSAPIVGPSNPFISADSASRKRKNVLTGYAEESAISDSTFRTQQRTFISLGYAQDPSLSANGNTYVGNQDSVALHGGKDVVQLRPSREETNAIKRKRTGKGDPSVIDGDNAYVGPWARYNMPPTTLSESEGDEEEEGEEEYAAPASNPIIDKAGKEYLDVNTGGVGKETTDFHGSQQYDYQGRTYMHVPQDLDVDLKKELGSWTNYIPKKLVHTWKGHTKPITALRFFPGAGHLLLSSSSDAKVKIWDVYHDRELLRTYNGHSKAVTDITFNNDGTQFLTASYDRYMKLWDTETGKCVHRYTTGKIPHVIRFNPEPNLHHEFLAGMSDKKIIQFDTRTEEVVQEYDHHLGPVNTITFVDENRRFITTSDDKSLRAWEYGIPVPIKFIAEPYMYSMVRASLHPSGKYVAYQSGDNQVVVYAATDKFRQNRKKVFRGHNNAGYAIDVNISPDGQFLMSGDSGGFLCFWDWKTCKMYHKFQASDGPVVAAQWHPQETSKVASAGLDNVIKYWD